MRNMSNFKKAEERFFEMTNLYARAIENCGACDVKGIPEATIASANALCEHIESLFLVAKNNYMSELLTVLRGGTTVQNKELGCVLCIPEYLGNLKCTLLDEETLGILGDLFETVSSAPYAFVGVKNFAELHERYIQHKNFDGLINLAFQMKAQDLQVSEEESERTRASIWKKLQESCLFKFETPENTSKTVKVEGEIPSKGFTLSREYPVDASSNPVVEDTPRNDGALFVVTKDDETSVKVSTPLFDVEVHRANNDGNNYRLNDVYPLHTMDVPVKGNVVPKAGVFATPAKDFPIEAVLARRDGAYYPVGMFATFTADFFTK